MGSTLMQRVRRGAFPVSMVLLITVLFGGLVLYYDVLQEDAEHDRHNYDRHSRGVLHAFRSFVDEARENLNAILNSWESAAFLQSVAMGASEEYGLKQSRASLRARMNAFIDTTELTPEFTYLAFFDREDRALVSTGGSAEGQREEVRKAQQAARAENRDTLLCLDQNTLLFIVPWHHRDQCYGTLVAAYNMAVVRRMIQGQMHYFKDHWSLRAETPGGWINVDGSQPADESESAEAGGSALTRWELARHTEMRQYRIAGTPFLLEREAPTGAVLGFNAPTAGLVGTALLCLIVVLTIFSANAASNKAHASTVLLAKARDFAGQMQEKNSQLQEEITRRVAAEDARQEAESQLAQAQKLESIGRLAGGVAHDFNNLLSVIMAYCELLDLDQELNPIQREHVVNILQAVERARSVTGQLLAFSRKQVIQPRIINFNDQIAESMKVYARLIPENITLDFTPSPGLPCVLADPQQFEQALANLLVNARDAIAARGNEVGPRLIQVETTHVKDYNSLPQGLNPVPGGYVCVSVRDSGVGMNEGTLQQVFDPFFTLKEQGKGTGLGLATVLGIAKQNQGDVLVESEMGRGSLFRIFWPVCEGECQHKPPRKTGGLRKGKETVLFVEDEEAIRNAGAITLRRAGYNVVTADSGIAALEHLADPSHSAPDLVITDIIMPYMSGFELAARLRDVLPDVPVLFTTGYCDDVVPDFTHQDGEDHVLHKPYGAIELTHRVQQTLQSAPGIR